MKRKLTWTRAFVIVATILMGGLFGTAERYNALGWPRTLTAEEDAKLQADLRESERTRLKDLNGVTVFVYFHSPEESEENRRLKVAIETRLIDRKVPVSTARGAPVLQCGAMYKTVDGKLYLTTNVNLQEEVAIVRNKHTFFTETWDSKVTVFNKSVSAVSFDSAKQNILEGVDEFINDYLVANKP